MSGNDLIVVGSGPWGLAIAWRAARAGGAVTLLDDGGPPAAWAAAGMLGPWSEAVEGEERLLDLQRRALDGWPALLSQLSEDGGDDAGFERRGTLHVAARPEQIPVVRRRAAHIERLGHDERWRGGSDLRRIEPSLAPTVAGGLRFPEESQVDPRRLLSNLRTACSTRGVMIVNDEAVRLDRAPDGTVGGVTLASGRRLEAADVVLAAGWSAGRLAGRVPLRPVKGQAIRLRVPEAKPPPVSHVVRTPDVYVVTRTNGEIVVGATSEERGDARPSAEGVYELLDDALEALPALGEMDFAEVTTGLRPATADGSPALGRDSADRLIWAVGGYRHGVLLTPLVAEAIGLLLEGRPPSDLSDLSPDRFPEQEPVCA